MARKKSTFTPREKTRCSICKGTSRGVLCESCKARIRSSGFNPAVVCPRCDKITALLPKHGREIAAQCKSRQATELTVVIYDDIIGCPECPKREDDCIDAPHSTVYRLHDEAA